MDKTAPCSCYLCPDKYRSASSAAIFIMALGIMYRDGLSVIVGMITAVIGLIISTTVVVVVALLGMAALEKFTNFL